MAEALDILKEYQARKKTQTGGDEASSLLAEYRGQAVEEPGFFQGIKQAITGEDRETGKTRELPELSYARGVTTGDFGKDLQVASGLMFAAGDEAKKDIIKEQFGDQVQIEDDEKGNTILTFANGKQAVLNKPGMSFADVQSVLGDIAVFFGPTKLAGVGRGLMAKLGIGGLAAATTEAYRQEATKSIGSKQEVDPFSVGMTGLFGAASEAAPAVVSAVKKIPGIRSVAKKAKEMGVKAKEIPDIDKAVTPQLKAAEEVGGELLPAQAMGSPSGLRTQADLLQLEGSAKQAWDAIKSQDESTRKAVDNVLDMISSSEKSIDAPEMIRRASKSAIKKAEKDRLKAAGRFYERAYKDKNIYDAAETLDYIENRLSKLGAKSPRRKPLEALKKDIGDGKHTIEQLDQIKRDIDDLQRSAKRAGEGQLSSDLKRVKDIFIREADRANPDYRKARKIYERMTKEIVGPLKESRIGKYADMDDRQLQTITNDIFKAFTTTKQTQQIKQVIKAADPDAWNAITRRRFEDILADTGTSNPEQVFNKLFKKNTVGMQLFQAVDGEAKKKLVYLKRFVDSARKGRVQGSDTAYKQASRDRINKGWANFVSGFFTPGESIKGFFKGINQLNRQKAAANVFFNPRFDKDWQALRKMAFGSEEAERKLKNIFTKALKEYAKPTAQAARAKATEE